MPEVYFQKFPIINYDGFNCRNLTKRAKVIHQRNVIPDNYYPLEIDDRVRSDVLANQIYSDPTLDWLVYLDNQVIDPYYDWHLNSDEFVAYINDKYGSIEVAMQKTAYYRTQWPSGNPQENQISITDYYQNIPGIWQKYFQPIFDHNGTTMFYMRKFLDWRVNTNKMIQWNISGMTANTTFAIGNVVNVIVAGNPVGHATVVTSNDSVVVAQHVTGSVNTGGLQDMFNANVTAVITSISTIQTNLTANEEVFWESLSFYDLEDERNTLKKYISIVNPNIVLQVTSQIQTTLNGK